jgi:hypothetical protein
MREREQGFCHAQLPFWMGKGIPFTDRTAIEDSRINDDNVRNVVTFGIFEL